MLETKDPLWIDSDLEDSLPILTIDQALDLEDPTKESILVKFLQNWYESNDLLANLVLPSGINPNCPFENFPSLGNSRLVQYFLTLHQLLPHQCLYSPMLTLETPSHFKILALDCPTQSMPMEILPGRTLNINPNLSLGQIQDLITMLKDNKVAFSWEYQDMCAIHPDSCTHHIYIDEGSHPIRQQQRRLNLALREIVKEELQKLLNVGFIYPISDSRWVSPLVVVPK